VLRTVAPDRLICFCWLCRGHRSSTGSLLRSEMTLRPRGDPATTRVGSVEPKAKAPKRPSLRERRNPTPRGQP